MDNVANRPELCLELGILLSGRLYCCFFLFLKINLFSQKYVGILLGLNYITLVTSHAWK